MTYTNITNVSAELNGMTLNSSSVPTSSTVEGWITEAESNINLVTGQVWSSTVVGSSSPEYNDYDGSGSIFLRGFPIISIDKFEYESNGINGETENWVELEEGRTSNKQFIVYPDEAELQFHGTPRPLYGFQNTRVQYTYGYETVPTSITHLASKIVAKRVIESVTNGSASTEGGSLSVGTISISDPTNFGINRLKNIQSEIDDLYRSVGTMKTYRLNRNY